MNEKKELYFCCTNCGSIFKVESEFYSFDEVMNQDTSIPKTSTILPTGDIVWFHTLCKGRIVGPFDKEIVNSIAILYAKGYEIIRCCKGTSIDKIWDGVHLHKDKPYAITTDAFIEFAVSPHYKLEDVVKTLESPEGWSWDFTSWVKWRKGILIHTAESYIPKEDNYDIWNDVKFKEEYCQKKVSSLYDWAIKLPSIKR